MANLTGFKSDNKALFIEKDSDANIKYGMDFTDYLNAGDGLATATVTITSPTGDSDPVAFPTSAGTDTSIAGAVVSVRLTGGTDGNNYNIKIKVTTSAGDTDSRSFRIFVKDKQA